MKKPYPKSKESTLCRADSVSFNPFVDPLFHLSRKVLLIVRLYSPVEVYRGDPESA